ncbi:MAG: M28 family peptidase [Gemmatimonadaceae bacterium]
MRRAVLLVLLAGCASGARTAPGTLLPISAAELRRDLFAFAADSLAGREAGTPYELRAARFLVNRLISLGLEPAGDSLYYQRVPLVKETFAPGTELTVAQGQAKVPLGIGTDVVPWVNLGAGAPLPKRMAAGELFFAGYGTVGEGRNDFQGIRAAGHTIVILHGAPASVTDTARRQQLETQEELAVRIGRAIQYQPSAIIVLTVGKANEFYQQMVPYLSRSVTAAPGDLTTSDTQRPLPMILLGTAKRASVLLPTNWPADESPQLLAGRMFAGRVEVRKTPFTSYNVVAIARGSQPRFNKTYVAYGAHYDHVGIQPGMRPDSIANGADDDGSGSVTLLAIAKSTVNARPKRSTLFVWHAAEEKGLLGSAYYTAHPTVPIDSIVAQINSDMIGRRGGATANFNSVTSGAGAVNRVYVIGPKAAPSNQSRVLGTILDSVNARQARPLEIDPALDAPNHPERYYERSDHYNYALKGIPVIMLSTGFHEDYHKVSDEPTKIDFEKMARIGSLMLEFGITLANREGRPR